MMVNQVLRNLLMPVCIALAAFAATADADKWELVSEYNFDGTFTPTPIPGAGTSLLDSGPGQYHLATFDMGTTSFWPTQISPGADGAGNAFTYDSTQFQSLRAPSFDFSEGFRWEFYFKDSGSQTNPYPSVLTFADTDTRKTRIEARPLSSAVPGPIAVIWFYVGESTGCSITGNWNDGQWHKVVAEYDPVRTGQEIFLQVDSQTAFGSSGIDNASIANPVFKVAQNYNLSTQGDRGFNGSIDNIKIYRRLYQWLEYSYYDFEGSYDPALGTGDALLDKGPIGANHLIGVSGTWDVNTAPSQVDGADPNTTEDGAFLFETVSDGAAGFYCDGVKFPFDMDCKAGFKIECDFFAGNVQPASVYIELIFGQNAGSLWGIQMYSPDGANVIENAKTRFGGTDSPTIYGALPLRYSDQKWRHLTGGFCGKRRWVGVDAVRSYKFSSTTVPANPTAVVLARQQTHNVRYAYQGKIDNLKLSYLKQAELTYPAGGQTLYQGQIVEISWQPLGYANVSLLFSENAGQSWSVINGNLTNSGTYLWTVPNIASTDCMLKLTNTTNTAQLYSASAAFSVEQPVKSDLNKDGKVDEADLDMLASDWLECGNPFGCD